MNPAERGETEPRQDTGEEGVLVDSSLWIEYYHPAGDAEAKEAVRRALAEDRVAVMAMVLIEILRGSLTRESFDELESDLTALHWLDVTPAVARRAGEIGFTLERAGTRVPATDLLIAATAIEYEHALWHNDGHFEVIADNSALVERRFAKSGPA